MHDTGPVNIRVNQRALHSAGIFDGPIYRGRCRILIFFATYLDQKRAALQYMNKVLHAGPIHCTGTSVTQTFSRVEEISGIAAS